ncbi:MAG: polysaccharide deacetylase family protein [Bacteroidales bacterium]|nr:polysaccharide deacetylase family protein [Bacteroidales bacterium]
MKFDVQVYTTQTSSRLTYAVDLVLGNILGLAYTITDSPYDGIPLINYSYDRSVGGIFIQPEGLLFQKGIRMQEIWVAHLDGTPLFFQQPPEAGFQLDIFSFAFYLVTRYEEYLTHERDEHERFVAESSLAYKHNFLDLPVVDIWAQRLGVTLKLLYPDLVIPEKKYDYLLTVDVDQPFKYRGRGLFRNLGGLFMDFVTDNEPGRRFKCMTGRMKDSYDTYAYINDIADKYNCPVLYFFTTGDRSRYDRNISPYKRCYKKLIRRLSKKHSVGLHSSYSSGNLPKLIVKEKEKLENVVQQKITKIRQHYLLLTLPYTFQAVEDTGIMEDYTLGHIREAGFRAGIARPFKFYDLSREEPSSLTIVPFQYADTTFQKYKRYDPAEAIESVSRLISRTKEVGGLFVSVWHNTSLTDKGEWKGWRRLFKYTLEEQQQSSIK